MNLSCRLEPSLLMPRSEDFSQERFSFDIRRPRLTRRNRVTRPDVGSGLTLGEQDVPPRPFFRDILLTPVSLPVTPQSSLIEGRGAEAHCGAGARAVPAGGFAACSRAAWASCLPALRPGWEVHPWTGTGEGG